MNPPDIDVDFEHERREEVIQYIYQRYGRERAALAATVITYRPRSAIRDVGKALGLDPLFIEQLSQSLSWWDRSTDLQAQFEKAGARGTMAEHFYNLLQEILGFPRHLSQHVGGFIITKSPISTLVPVENASMPDRTVIQWDKEDIEALGLLKIDILAWVCSPPSIAALILFAAIRASTSACRLYPKKTAPPTICCVRQIALAYFKLNPAPRWPCCPGLNPAVFMIWSSKSP